MILFGAVLPSYSSKDKKKSGKSDEIQEIVKADNPRNSARIRKIIDEYE